MFADGVAADNRSNSADDGWLVFHDDELFQPNVCTVEVRGGRDGCCALKRHADGLFDPLLDISQFGSCFYFVKWQ